MRARATVPLLAAAATTASCTSEASFEADALDCFRGGGPPPGATEEGTIEILESRGGYHAIDEDQDLMLVEGLQPGFHFNVSARIQGLEPGDPEDTLAPENPHTIFTVSTEDGGRIDNSNRGWRLGYEAGGDFDYLSKPRRARLSDRVTKGIVGERVRLSVEIVDAEKRYARDDVWVTAIADSESDRPDAGAPDAGLGDAAAPDAESARR